MSRLGLAALLLTALTLASCGEANGQAAKPDPAAGEARAVTANEYVRRAGTANLFEIQAGNLGLQKSEREDIRALARMLVDDHTRAVETLKEATGKTLGISAPPGRLDNAHQAKLQRLQSAAAPEFDRLFIEILRQSHEETLALHKSYASLGDNAALKVTASELATVMEKHIGEMQRMGDGRTAPPPRG